MTMHYFCPLTELKIDPNLWCLVTACKDTPMGASFTYWYMARTGYFKAVQTFRLVLTQWPWQKHVIYTFVPQLTQTDQSAYIIRGKKRVIIIISRGQINESIVVDLPADFGPSPVSVGIVQARFCSRAWEIWPVVSHGKPSECPQAIITFPWK